MYQTKKTNENARNSAKSANLTAGYSKIKVKSDLIIGQTLDLSISSQGANSVGIVPFLGGYTILVPNTQLGDKVKVKIVKIHQSKSGTALDKQKKYAFAKVIQVLEKGKKQIPVSVGENLKVKIISSKQSTAVAKIEGANPYVLLIAQENAKIGDSLDVVVTRLKTNYGFAKTQKPTTGVGSSAAAGGLVTVNKYNIILPKKAKLYGNLVALTLRNNNQPITKSIRTPDECTLFVKLAMGAQLGDNVRIKVSKVFQSKSGLPYAFAKVIKVNPISIEKKQQKIKQSIEQMLKSGMHFGEKAVNCQAKMREYIWIRKKGRNKNRPFIKKGRHFLNLLKTRRCLNQALSQLTKYAVKGRTFLFVGTKKPAASLISRAALFSKKSFFVNTRWLGGMLTNWKTILKSISKIRPILKEKQRIIQMILTKRQGIKLRLMKKMITSMSYIQKGRQFLEKIKTDPSGLIKKKNAFTAKRKELIQKGQVLLSKRQQLLEKRKELFKQSQLLKEKGYQVVNKYENLLTQLINQRQKLRELRNLFLISREIQKMKKTAMTINVRKPTIENTTKSIRTPDGCTVITGPNPSKEILNKIIQGLALQDITKSIRTPDEGSFKQTEKAENAKSRVVLMSKLLSKFSHFSSYIKTSMKAIYENINEILTKVNVLKEALKQIQKQMTLFITIKKKVLVELNKLKMKLVSEQKVIKLLKNKIQRSAAEKKFLKFLPKLRYLPTATADATNSIQILMQKFVDPKIKQASSALQIYDDKLRTKSKKIAAARKKKWQRLEKYFGGVANMLKMNKNKISKNVAIIIGQQEEMNAVRECQKLGIQMFHVVDTNCNPTLANHFVPANDDSRNSIKFILTKFLTHIRLAQKIRLRLWQPTLTTNTITTTVRKTRRSRG
jgi:small subunit ribosomal protein S2